MVSILITERFSLSTLVKMKTNVELNATHDPLWFQKPVETWKAIEILIIRSQTKVDLKLISNFPSLKLIISATAGFNHIDLKLCQEREIRVSHCPKGHTASTAELTWGLILSCARRLYLAQKQTQNGDWNRNPIMGTEVMVKTLGLVGLGRVGTHVVRIAKAFDMKTLAYDPYQEDQVFLSNSVERVSLQELLSQSDVVSLHVPLTKETWHMMGEDYLSSLTSESILINTCRGPVIHENALVQKLLAGKIGAVGLDVYENEPLSKESKLLQFPNVITTPHIGASTKEAFEKISEEAFKKVLQYLSDSTLEDELPPRAAWYQ